MDVRSSRILKHVNIRGRGLELGPLTSPILAKGDANVEYVDHLSLQDLKSKYKNEPVDLDRIMAPDYVLGDNTLSKVVGGQKFDYVIASHVVEHVPNTIEWLQDIARVLKSGGVLALVVPDKRFTFDIARKASTPSEVVGAYYDKLTRFSSAMMYDFARNCVSYVDSATAWDNPEGYKDAPKRWSIQEVREMCANNLDLDQYVDCHCYTYTPASFCEILRELTALNLFDYEVIEVLDTQPGELEFYVSLKKISKSSKTKKRVLATIPSLEKRDMVAELRHENELLRQDIHMIKNSVSWRLTRGIRLLRTILNRIVAVSKRK